MTAHRCCPECGAELTVDGGKFCGCVGPFAAEHVDPMHIRPYVDLPEPEDEGTRTPDLEPFARCGQAETAELPVLRPYGQETYGADELTATPAAAPAAAADAHAYDYDHAHAYGHPYADGYEGDLEVRPVSRGGGHRRRKGRGSYAYGRDEGAGAGRRRKPAKAVIAAAGVVAALGAGLLTAQSLADGGAGDDRGLSTDDTALPDISGGPTEDPTRTQEHKGDKKPSGEPTSRNGSAGTRADRDSGRHTGEAPAPEPTSPSTEPGTPSGSESQGRDPGRGGGNGDGHRPRPPQESTQPGGETLRRGDSGPEVAELQRRLKQVGALDEDAAEDGVYSQQVQQAVTRYQAQNNVRGDDFGEYGPNTRRALESETSG
ncbi:peptidoglycan-binding domain-containing protein [Streptomyces winkii]|uniref:peptidoglycan-binding domain-containing protein n=1 Tax=Streptomyces winkii TaxID=3051178 RepID=UPI0028D2FB3C|nr:peptidoglycan-binding domain-containing protein [Streptomyces sp. DSM 40971]